MSLFVILFPPFSYFGTPTISAMKEKESQEEAAKMDPAMLEHIAFFESEDDPQEAPNAAAPQQTLKPSAGKVFNSFGWVNASQVRMRTLVFYFRNFLLYPYSCSYLYVCIYPFISLARSHCDDCLQSDTNCLPKMKGNCFCFLYM